MKILQKVRFWVFLSLGALSQGIWAYDCQDLEAWKTISIYTNGDLVTQDNIAYRANWWTRSQSPAQNSSQFEVWKNLGKCNDVYSPSITLLTPKDGSVLKVNDSAIFSADASASTGHAISSVEFFVNDASVGVDTNAPYQVLWQAIEGNHLVHAIATDSQGLNAASKTASITVSPSPINTPPTVELLSPANNSQYQTGQEVFIEANAQDSDGEIKVVNFYINEQLIKQDTQAPYRSSWLAELGEHTIKVVAIDNLDKSAVSQSSIKVTQSNSGGCKNIPNYSSSANYTSGDQVAHNNHKYTCNIGPWCSSSALWAYEPGVGLHWQDAWTDDGICAIRPEVTFLNPAANSTLLQGKVYNIEVQASDTDGQITLVDIYAGTELLSSQLQPPYKVSWVPQALGNVELSAIAKDNEGNETRTSQMVKVTDKPLISAITAPTAGSQFTLGSSITISADATAVIGQISKVSFYSEGVLIGTVMNAPYSIRYTPASLGNKTLSVIAQDEQGNTASSEGVSIKIINTPIAKKHKLIGYWHNFVNPAGCPIPLNLISPAWDIIDIAFADNDRNSNGTVHFNLFEKDIRSNCPPIDPVQFKADIKQLQAQGKVFVLSLGGAEGTITLNTDSDEINFVASLTNIIKEWGFDGLDIDLESGSNLVHGSQIQSRLPRALKQIEQNIGGDMVLTMAPEHPYVHGGMIAYSGIWGAYIPLINELRDTLDLLHVQLYNNGGLSNPYESGIAPEGSVNMMVAHAKMLIEGFELANGTQFLPLRDDQVAIGLPSGPRSANSGQAPIANITAALDCLISNTRCSSIVPSKTYPNFGGVMTWSINWDKYDGYNFSKPVAEKLTQLNQK